MSSSDPNADASADQPDRLDGGADDGSDTSASSALTKALRDVAPYLDLGWRLAGSAAFPPLLGVVVDLWLGTLPWGLLIGCALGLAAAVLQLTRLQDDFK